MESKVNYTLVGIFVIVLSIAFTILLFWLASFQNEKVYQTYLVYMKEDVTGLSVQSPVRFNGVPVGLVKSIKIDPNNPQLVKIELLIEKGTPITTATVALLQYQGITGVLNIGLKAKSMKAPPLVAKPGEKYPVIPAQPSLFVQISEIIPNLTKTLDNISKRVEKLLAEDNLKAINQTLRNMDKFTSTLAENSKLIEQSAKNLDETLKNTAAASKDFPAAVKNLDSTLTTINTSAQHISKAANSFNKTMQTSDIAIKNFSNQVLPSAQQMLMQIGGAAKNIDTLALKLQRNPSALIRGQMPAAPGPGEKP